MWTDILIYTFDPTGVAGDLTNNDPLRIGNHAAPGDISFFPGVIDDVSIYSRALTTAEIQSIYTAGSAGKCASTSLSGVPVITSVLPGVGAVSNIITISGNNFSPNPAGNLVRFGAVQASILTASATQLTVAVPPGATFSPITVTVNGLVAFANQPFEPTFSGTGAAITTSSFAPSFNLPTGSNPACVVVADFDGDGKPDLAQVNYDGHTVSLYRNVSTGGALSAASLAARVDLPLPAGANGGNAYRLRAVDLDGDGKLDLIVSEAAGSRVVIFRNIAAPGSLTTSSFEAPVSISAGNDARFATAADLDGDGRAELISLNYADNTISIFKNIGTGGSLSSNSFAAPVNLGSAAGPYELAVGDLDGDGKPDLAVVNASANVISVFRNTTTPGMIDASSFAPRVDFPSQNFGDTIAIGDLDGDGKPDITVVGELPDYMSVFKNVSTPGSFTSASLAPRVDFGTGWNAWGVAAGDLDGDGRPDVVLVNQYDSTMTIYQNLSPFGGTPFITTQPADQTVTTGNTASFSVLAGGDTQLTYQWRFNDTNISGATNTSLTLFNVQSNQAGSYSVVVSNSFGSLTSSNALLTVNPAVCLTPPSGLVGWWSAESNVLDNVSGNNGTLAGGASFAPGKIGQGFRFDGVNGYVQIPDSALLKPAHVTVEAWVWLDPNVNAGPTTECIIFKRNSWTYLFEGYNLAKSSLDTGNGTYSDRFFFVITRNGNQVIINSTTVAQRGVWYHVAATYDGNQATLFVNGVAEASAAPGFALDYGDRPIFIGTSGEPAPYTSMLAGIIDEPSIYARALATNEIAALYNAGGADKCNVPVAPTIVVQPQDSAAPFGGTAMFNVAAGGTLPLSYQWFVNSNALHDETNSSLTLNNLTLSQSGNLYSVTITNTGGFTLSSNAVLTVINTPPQISNPGSHIVSYLAPPQSLAFTVSDAESPASSLQVTVSSSNTNLVPNEQIILSGTDTNRTITLTQH